VPPPGSHPCPLGEDSKSLVGEDVGILELETARYNTNVYLIRSSGTSSCEDSVRFLLGGRDRT